MKDREYIIGKSSGNGAFIPADNVIEVVVVVEWNGQIKEFNLSPVKEPIQIQ